MVTTTELNSQVITGVYCRSGNNWIRTELLITQVVTTRSDLFTVEVVTTGITQVVTTRSDLFTVEVVTTGSELLITQVITTRSYMFTVEVEATGPELLIT